MKKIAELTAELAAPVAAEQGCTIWDVEYVKEAGTWYLRVLLDKEGGVDILDCEAISRKVSDLLDEADPIEGSYTLEVGSAGAERALRRPGDFVRFMGSPVTVRLYRNRDGRKEFAGALTGYDEGTGAVTVRIGDNETTFDKADTALVRLRVEFS
ncbi:ribosome maturation factor RimP [Oscillibacter sp.]|uniref:ribosome maturation factor RimP n=1 Tax=Oscillibacter sp. TaxID=1945593 RepID=UPI00289D473F|nr:ribosome maturation factor RimP [Oscillibacter sp.]